MFSPQIKKAGIVSYNILKAECILAKYQLNFYISFSTFSFCIYFFLIDSFLSRVTAQILANVIIFMCGNMAGAYHKHLMELALKQTYQDTCNCIKSPIKLEFEKRQQVKT